MTNMIFSTDGKVSPGTKCPTHKLEIKKMNEIQKTEEEIKILQAKLKFLKEMENSKSSAEKAYCEVYGEYPRSCARWNGFLTGYDLGYIHGAEGKDKFVPHQEHFGLKKEDCKVEEEPEPETLYEALTNIEYIGCCYDDILDAVRCWLPKEQSAKGSQNVYVECTVDGFNDCLKKIKSKLK